MECVGELFRAMLLWKMKTMEMARASFAKGSRVYQIKTGRACAPHIQATTAAPPGPAACRESRNMFKKPVSSSGKTKIKSSVQRNIRQKICEQYPLLAPVIEDILPKKAQLDLIKAFVPDSVSEYCGEMRIVTRNRLTPDRISLYALDNQVLFFQSHDDAIMPHLKVVHKCALPDPQCFPKVQVDRGAIRFILGGAQLMCPGLTSPGAKLPPADENIPEGTVVVINAEGKEHACMVGILKMSTEDIKKLNKGNGVENCHYLGDGLWKLDSE
ncbi:hypothetical protein Dda_5924 [Drechslerella dactyloides]|uniref:PUA domain-containing protein n=1 Tax=Drechslerella dactyloides TaxID=74499 RepID=A0AAD6NJG7_DREDA|nr:hypothetical protein Dda_5924 [Drechslerella dactyloides]